MNIQLQENKGKRISRKWKCIAVFNSNPDFIKVYTVNLITSETLSYSIMIIYMYV